MTDTQVMAALSVTQADREALHKAGWRVAVHNDYRLNGQDHTFWLFTHPNGRWIKGEGRNDAEALAQCATAIASSPAATLPDCIVNGDVEAWLFSHPDRDGDMEAGRLELFNFRMGYAAPVTPPAADAEVRKALEPFAKYADAVLKRRDGAEPEPVPDDRLVFGMDGQHISIGDLRRARSALATPPSVPAQGEREWDGHLTAEEQAMIDAA